MAPVKKTAGKGKGTKTVKKVKKNERVGKVVVDSGFNNTRVTFTDLKGNVISWSSSGQMGFKGSRKSTPFAGQLVGEDAARKAQDIAGMTEVDIEVKGPGSGRESALRAIQATGMVVKSIKDTTPIPHNGVKAKKRRRV